MKKPAPKKKPSRFVEDGTAGVPFKVIKKAPPAKKKPQQQRKGK